MFICGYMLCSFKIGDKTLMEKHIVQEHGAVCKGTYSEIAFHEDDVEEKVGKRGQTRCSQCGTFYNNRKRPDMCTCGSMLRIRANRNTKLNAFQLTDKLFSVRRHEKGAGARVIVQFDNKMCYMQECLDVRATYVNVANFSCVHLDACSDPRLVQPARDITIDLKRLTHMIKCGKTISELRKEAGLRDKVTVYQLPNNNIAVPLLNLASHECKSGFIHIDTTRLKCPLNKCSRKPKYHHLVKAGSLCIHTILCKLARNEDVAPPFKSIINLPPSKPQFSKSKTVTYILEQIVQNIPSFLLTELRLYL